MDIVRRLWSYLWCAFLKCYGVIRTRRLSTRTFGLFHLLNARNVSFGERCCLNTGVLIQGRCRVSIEDDVVLSPRCMLLDSGLDPVVMRAGGVNKHIESFIVVEKGAWIGAGAIVLSGVTVGEYSIVGAGSVVIKDVPAHATVVGNPARLLSGESSNNASTDHRALTQEVFTEDVQI
jgi:maltose O-acetyltransferase